MKVLHNYPCPKCRSCMYDMKVNKLYHKILVRKCVDNCENDNKVVKDYGYSEKAKIKMERRKLQEN